MRTCKRCGEVGHYAKTCPSEEGGYGGNHTLSEAAALLAQAEAKFREGGLEGYCYFSPRPRKEGK